VKEILDIKHAGEQPISFSLSIIICVGLALWILNGSYGLACIPVYLYKGNKSILETKSEMRNDLARIRKQYRSIQEKYAGSHTKITKEDQKMLNYLKKKELSLAVKNVQIDIEDTNGFIPRIVAKLRPFSKLLGIITFVISGLIFSAILLTTINRLRNSECGFKCGFIVEKSQLLNPMDWLLVKLSSYFPADYLIFYIIVSYIFICSFYGNIKLGTRIIFKQKYELRRDGTLPKTLLITGFLTCIMTLALYSQIMTLSPQYTTFGNQHYLDASKKQMRMCALTQLSSHKVECQASYTSTFFNKISLGMPIISSLIFVGNFIFIFLFIILFAGAWKKEKKARSEFDIELQEDDRESSNLLDMSI